MKKNIVILLLLHFSLFSFAQEMGYEVRGIYKKPILKEKLNAAKTISDINAGYPASWIAGYVSVEILATYQGTTLRAASKNDTLNTEQINILNKADVGTAITVDVKYLPNSSRKNDIKKINFSYTVIPEIEAEYPGGYERLKQYLKASAMDEIAGKLEEQLQVATVKFTVNEGGEIINAQVSQTSDNEKVDQLLLEAIYNMPKWKPAENSKGIKVKQDFEFSIGNIIGC